MVLYLTKTDINSKELELNSHKQSQPLSENHLNHRINRLSTNLKLSSISGINNNNKAIIGSNIKSNTISSTNVDRNEETPETTSSTTTTTITTKASIECDMKLNDTIETSTDPKLSPTKPLDCNLITNDNNVRNNGKSSNDMTDRSEVLDITEDNSGSTSCSTLTKANNSNNSTDRNIYNICYIKSKKANRISIIDNNINNNAINNDKTNDLLSANSTSSSSSSTVPLTPPLTPPLTASLPSPQLASSTSTAQALLICRKNSHPFTERRLSLDAPAKVGRAVARCKPSNDNSIFDCKVLSRNHALLWYENEKFFLQDTRSSNGTFINNQRLSPANEESAPREVCSGDIVQFGVDVMENSRKVTHGCIIATIKLYLPDGTEAKASRVTQSEETQFNASQMQNQFQGNNVCISSQELYELSQYLNEAIHREQILENKLETLQRVVTNAQESAHSGWKSLVEEDRLLSRIETLQCKLEVCLNSTANNNSKGINSEESVVVDIKQEMLKLIDDKEKYECAAKEAIQKALEEKLLVLTRLHELEISVKSSEDECNRLQEVCETSAKEINRIANINDELNKEIEDLAKRLKAAEDQKTCLTEAANKEKLLLEQRIQELKAKETETTDIINELKSMNETANIVIEQLKLQLEIIKQEKVISDGNASDGNSSGDNKETNKLSLEEELIDVQKQLELSNLRCNELSAQMDALRKQTISTTPLSDSVETNVVLTNGEIISTNDNKSTDLPLQQSVIMEVNANTGSNSVNENNTSHLNSEIDLLKELLAETRASKKSTEEELSQTLLQLENLRSNSKKFESDADCNQIKVDKTLKEIQDKSIVINSLKNQLKETNEKLKLLHSESESIKCKIADNEKLLLLKDEEINSLKVLLEEERKVQIKYANNYEQCRKQLLESQHQIRQSQTESELLRKKVYSCNEELRSSRSNLSATDETSKSSKEYQKLKNECLSLQSKLHSVESELLSYRDSNNKLIVDYESLQNSFQLLQKLNNEIQSKGDNYWREQFNTAKSDSDDAHSQLIRIKEQFEELKKNFEDCSKDNEGLNEELKSAKEDYEIVSYQSKIASACAIIPLIMLLMAVLMAYYPSVSTVTGTADS